MYPVKKLIKRNLVFLNKSKWNQEKWMSRWAHCHAAEGLRSNSLTSNSQSFTAHSLTVYHVRCECLFTFSMTSYFNVRIKRDRKTERKLIPCFGGRR